MNFQQLEYIVAVDKNKHFGKAAKECNITQATLSGMIIKLEEQMNVKIFDRSSSPIEPTEEGIQIINIAKDILTRKKQIENIQNISSDTLSGTITIGIIPTIACNLLPLTLNSFINNHPNLKLNIQEKTTDEIINEINNNNIDLGILATPIENSNLAEEILYYEPMMIYGVKDKSKKWISPQELENKKLWLLEEGHCFRTQAMTLCEYKEKSMSDNLSFQANSFDTLINITDEYGGYTLIPELYYNTFDETKKKRTRHFESPIPVREVSIVTNRPEIYKNTIRVIKELITSKVNKNISTSKFKKNELNIIGI